MSKLSQIDFDLRRLKGCTTPEQFASFFEQIGHDRSERAWAKLEENPIDAAVAYIAIGFAINWDDFCIVCKQYGVDKESSPKLNQQFRARLKELGLDKLVATWYTQANKEAV